MPLSKQPILYLAVATILLPLAAFATTWHVTPDRLGDAPTIQAAIDSSATGDSILVAAGVFPENIVLRPARILIGSWDPGFTTSDLELFQTTIDGDSTASVVTANYGDLQDDIGFLAGFRICGGAAKNPTGDGSGYPPAVSHKSFDHEARRPKSIRNCAIGSSSRWRSSLPLVKSQTGRLERPCLTSIA